MALLEFLKAFAGDFAALSLRCKCCLTLLAAVLVLGVSSVIYPDAAAQRLDYCGHWCRALVDDTPGAPMNAETCNSLRELQRSLHDRLAQRFDQLATESATSDDALRDARYNSWTLAQLSLALPAHARQHRDALLERIDLWRHADGVGFREFRGDPHRRIPVSAWCIGAIRAVYDLTDYAEVDYLLGQQNANDGWWGVYADTSDDAYASTYATAVSLAALCEVVDGGRDKELQLRCRNAIRLASDWLKSRADGPFWKDYPNHSGNVAVGHSGVVLFALHRAHGVLDQEDSEELCELDRRFLANLSSHPAMPEFSEISGLTVEEGKIDYVRVYFYPAVVMGIAAAHSNGRISDRANVSAWLQQAAVQMRDARELVADYPWAAAEYLIALNALLGEVEE